jgi:hypothetical protein
MTRGGFDDSITKQDALVQRAEDRCGSHVRAHQMLTLSTPQRLGRAAGEGAGLQGPRLWARSPIAPPS